MDKNSIGLIVALVLLLILVGALYYGVYVVREKLRYYARMLFGTNSFTQGIEKMQMEYTSTPKSVSGATNLYLPRIVRDFPEFHLEEMKERAENVLVSYLRALEEKNPSLLTEGTKQLKEKLTLQISMLQENTAAQSYQDIKVHRTEIYQYRKEKGRCCVVFQSAVEYSKIQSKYNVSMIYIQDRELVEDKREGALALNCPNCGAPLSSLGAKICAYCDTPLLELNIKIWNFSDVEEAK